MNLVELLAELNDQAFISYLPSKGADCAMLSEAFGVDQHDARPHFHLIIASDAICDTDVRKLLIEADRHRGWITWLLMAKEKESSYARP